MEENVIYNATVLYRTLVTKGDDPTKTTFGEPERIGHTENIEVGNIGFDYNTGRMYGVDLTNGGLVVIDIETGAVDPIGEFKFPEGSASGDNVMTAMAVICEGEETTILCGSMNGNPFIVDPETMEATKVYTSSQEYWYYAGMTYDYNTGNIYWNPSMGSGINPLFLVTLEDTDWGSVEANVMDLGDVSSRSGVEQTAMFTIPENEPEANYIPVENLWLTNGDTYTGLAGAQVQLQTSTEPARPTVQKRTWSSDNTGVATVDAFGKVTLVDVGTATITVSLTDRDGTEYTDQNGAYNSQLSYDFGTDRLYFHAANITASWCSGSNLYMIEKEGDSFTAMKLGSTALNLRGESMQGYSAVLGMLCPIPEDSELPEMDVINLMLDRTVTRMLVGTTMAMDALVQPAVSSDKAQLVWSSSDESAACPPPASSPCSPSSAATWPPSPRASAWWPSIPSCPTSTWWSTPSCPWTASWWVWTWTTPAVTSTTLCTTTACSPCCTATTSRATPTSTWVSSRLTWRSTLWPTMM